MLSALVSALAFVALGADALPWSSPHHWPGKPNTTYGPDWQDYYAVTLPLPNVTFPLQRSWAGSISAERPNMANNSHFFWAFEKSNGSFTAESAEPWGIFLAGGPGYSSIASLLLENGPIRVSDTYTLEPGPTPWTDIADWMWLDLPVGVGYATVGKGGYAANEDDIADDFLGFMSNLLKIFPHLKTRPLYIAGESYAGRFIPFIMQHMYSMPEPPFKLAGITVGNPALGTPGVFENAPIVQVLETYPQIIGYDPDVLDYFRDQAHLCKLDLNLTYPQQGGHLPSVHIKLGGFGRQSIGNSTAPPPGQGDGFSVGDAFGASRRSFGQQVADAYELLPAPAKRAHVREEARLRWKRQHIGFDGATSITARKNNKTGADAGKGAYSGKKGHINSWYGCDLYHEMMYYAINYTAPWTELESFDFLDVPIALNPVKTILNPTTWMNDPQTRAAIHAPENADWTILRAYPWDNKAHGSDGSPATIDFSDEFAANASKAGVKVMWYSGNDDALSGHLGTEIAIQNTTFGGIQGFTKPPRTPWYDDDGTTFAGIVHQERGWSYVLVNGGGHQVPLFQPARAQEMIRRFFIGNDTLGSVEAGTYAPDPSLILPDGAVPGSPAIYFNGTYILPNPTSVSKWDAYLATALAAPSTGGSIPASSSATPSATSGASSVSSSASRSRSAKGSKTAHSGSASSTLAASSMPAASSTKAASTKKHSSTAAPSASSVAASTKASKTKSGSTTKSTSLAPSASRRA